MEDGFDIQVRRHLILGGPVVCRKDAEVLGPLADACFDRFSRDIPERVEPIDCTGDEDEYESGVKSLLKKLRG
jgi:hypothetical protein